MWREEQVGALVWYGRERARGLRHGTRDASAPFHGALRCPEREAASGWKHYLGGLLKVSIPR